MEKKRNDVNKGDLEEEHSKTEKVASLEILKKELKWNKEGKSNLCRGYGSGSRLSRKRQKKSAYKLETKGSKLYNIRALWQRSQDLSISSGANN